MLIVSFIRHGESLDNLKSIWAGHKDAELNELGVRQAKALGDSYADTRLDVIIASDLKRAHQSALALLDGQLDPKPSFKLDQDLREQYYGEAEGKPLMMQFIPGKSFEDHFRDGQYPMSFEREYKFPGGESMNDLAVRAERAIKELVLKPYLYRAISGGKDVHVAVVSHGHCISELIPALLKYGGGTTTEDYKGLMNTGWTRVIVQAKPGTEMTTGNGLENLPPLIVTVTDVNRHEHITNIKGTVEHDPTQRSIREFFGGGDITSKPEVQERN